MSNSSSLFQEPTAAAAAPDNLQGMKRKRRNADVNVEVIAMSAEELLAPHRFKCEMCGLGFHRDQNLQLHLRTHELDWKLISNNKPAGLRRRKVYVCPVPTCKHHLPENALGDLTGIRKHFGRKHGEKKLKCGRCDKVYAVESDLKAHLKTCGTGSRSNTSSNRGINFSRRNNSETHRPFSEAVATETARGILANQGQAIPPPPPPPPFNPQPLPPPLFTFPCSSTSLNPNPNLSPLHLPQLQNPNPPIYSFQNMPFSSLLSSGQHQFLSESAIFDQMDMGATGFGGEVGSNNNNGNPGDAAQVSMNMDGLLNCTEPRNPSDHGEGGEFMRPSAWTNGQWSG